KLKEFSSLPNLKMLLAAEGFEDILIHFIGGFSVMLQFQYSVSKDNILNHVGVGSWFSKLMHASTTFNIDERVTWIDIEGKVLWVRAKEVTRWAPNFSELEDDLTNYNDDSIDANELDKNVGIEKEAKPEVGSDVEEISETIF
nr:nucleotide-binding alpha-beta plait domain-containing protein [Tanacetum cinerariifolium]